MYNRKIKAVDAAYSIKSKTINAVFFVNTVKVELERQLFIYI